MASLLRIIPNMACRKNKNDVVVILLLLENTLYSIVDYDDVCQHTPQDDAHDDNDDGG